MADGKSIGAREQMAYAQFLAGMAFDNASLGYVHAMAHPLGGFYDLPHGVCNAILLPHVQAYNKQVTAPRLGDIARAMGETVDGLDDDAAANLCLPGLRKLSGDIGIPGGLAQIGVQAKDLPALTTNALKDVCGLTNPIQASHEEIRAIFLAAM